MFHKEQRRCAIFVAPGCPSGSSWRRAFSGRLFPALSQGAAAKLCSIAWARRSNCCLPSLHPFANGFEGMRPHPEGSHASRLCRQDNAAFLQHLEMLEGGRQADCDWRGQLLHRGRPAGKPLDHAATIGIGECVEQAIELLGFHGAMRDPNSAPASHRDRGTWGSRDVLHR